VQFKVQAFKVQENRSARVGARTFCIVDVKLNDDPGV